MLRAADRCTGDVPTQSTRAPPTPPSPLVKATMVSSKLVRIDVAADTGGLQDGVEANTGVEDQEELEERGDLTEVPANTAEEVSSIPPPLSLT